MSIIDNTVLSPINAAAPKGAPAAPLVLAADRTCSNLSNGGFGLKIGPFLPRYSHFVKRYKSFHKNDHNLVQSETTIGKLRICSSLLYQPLLISQADSALLSDNMVPEHRTFETHDWHSIESAPKIVSWVTLICNDLSWIKMIGNEF